MGESGKSYQIAFIDEEILPNYTGDDRDNRGKQESEKKPLYGTEVLASRVGVKLFHLSVVPDDKPIPEPHR
jgi:hypothetical protein